MAKVALRAYLSPTLVFLAFDWPDGAQRQDFLGFAIERSPGHKPGVNSDFLFNKIGFGKPATDPGPHSSDKAPIQKFHWWDSGINTTDRGKKFTYTVYPVCGTGPNDLQLIKGDASSIDVTVPLIKQNGIATYFNRAVVSSQSFKTLQTQSHNNLIKEMNWLANGMEGAIPDFLTGSQPCAGAIYHLTDKLWVTPAMENYKGDLSMVYHLKQPTAAAIAKAAAKGKKASGDTADLPAVQQLTSNKHKFFPRTKTSIMHHKFLVLNSGGAPASVLMGSANFTPEAFTVQANLLHTFDSRQLANCYFARQQLLKNDPTKGDTAKGAKWQTVTDIPGTKLRLFFSPEPKGHRNSIDAVVASVKGAKKSVLFCIFDPTDKDLLEAIMKAGDNGKMMHGLINSITDPSGKKVKDPEKAMANPTPAMQVKTEVYHRSRHKRTLSRSHISEPKTRKRRRVFCLNCPRWIRASTASHHRAKVCQRFIFIINSL
ncbi:MAG TPA: phospholipase [Verrucomicrobiae bacterium]